MEEEIIKEVDKLCSNWKPVPTKIKMKQHVYDEIATNCQKLCTVNEILDKFGQPLNTFNGLRIEIDDDIENDYEIE